VFLTERVRKSNPVTYYVQQQYITFNPKWERASNGELSKRLPADWLYWRPGEPGGASSYVPLFSLEAFVALPG